MKQTMNHFKTILLSLMLMFTSGVALAEDADELIVRDGIWYKKFTDVPFTGKVTGTYEGEIKDGLIEGVWAIYWDNGQLESKGRFKNGLREGFLASYYETGDLLNKGNYKNSKLEGSWVSYYINGQLRYKGNYKNGKREGRMMTYYEDGAVWQDFSGVYKNGKKISD